MREHKTITFANCCVVLKKPRISSARSVPRSSETRVSRTLTLSTEEAFDTPDPRIKVNDTIKIDVETGKVVEFIKFDIGNVVLATGGRNRGRIGTIQHREKHKGSFDIIHVVDAAGHQFASRMGNVFTIGQGTKPWVTLPRGKGMKLSVVEEARKRAGGPKASA
ncbi:unnamed protein product [Calypogeia fissa]